MAIKTQLGPCSSPRSTCSIVGTPTSPPNSAENGDGRDDVKRPVITGRVDDHAGNDGSEDPGEILPSAFWTPIQVPAARGPANIWATA